jgi:anti-sigma factor RsiW
MTDRIGNPPTDAIAASAMTSHTVHDNPELLISYVYDECEPEARARIEAHLSECAACAAEIEALGGTRRELSAWAPPDVALGFQITRPQATASSATVLRPARWWSRPMPAWAQAVAAALVFGAGLSLGGGVTLSRTEAGLDRDLSAGTRSAKAEATPAVTNPAERELVAEVGRLRAELAELRQARTDTAAAPALASALESAASRTTDQDALIDRVRALIDESEQRQRTEFTLRSAQLVRDVELQRRVDLTNMQRTIGMVQGQTGAEVRQNREALNYLGRVVATTSGNK